MSKLMVLSLVLSAFSGFNIINLSAAEFQRFQHAAKGDGSLSLLAVGDWGRRGAYNQSHVALQDLDKSLKESTSKWKIVVGHHTIKSAGHHGNTQELNSQLLPIMLENNVDLYINGHDHCLEHISSSESPLQFLTSGGGSKAWRGDVDWWNPKEMKFYYDGQGFMSVQITQTQVDIVFYDVSGHILHKWSRNKQLYSIV
ncbi:hypothetical protein GH714_042011 [Hevea brasiliensis]|uniref:Calcineurin-like phosphoesterase domain-containing protein n=1 Tax=Hevea brasiliensis TaxID=3981 RepID=A0A6A6MSY7_HEVBR|nr:hypothetical protein GH714_042011 [Hevea brasiliensis]